MNYRNKGSLFCAFMSNKTIDAAPLGETLFVSIFYTSRKTRLWKNRDYGGFLLGRQQLTSIDARKFSENKAFSSTAGNAMTAEFIDALEHPETI